MKIQIFCTKCNKLEIVDKTIKKEEVNPDKKKLTIPIPNVNNGLTTYSIVHSDHTLIVDIDAHGNVRGEKTIARIDQTIENILATISSKLLDYLDSNPSDQLSFAVITRDENLRKMLLGVFQQLIFNMDNDIQGLLSVSKDNALLEFGKITVYIGNWEDRIYNIISGEISFIYEINTDNFVDVLENIGNNRKQISNANFALLYEPSFVKSEIGKISLGELMTQIPSLQILDITDSEIAAMSLLTIVERAVMSKIFLQAK